jgi:hypothetical protein
MEFRCFADEGHCIGWGLRHSWRASAFKNIVPLDFTTTTSSLPDILMDKVNDCSYR